MLGPKVSRSTMAAQSRGSGKVFVQPRTTHWRRSLRIPPPPRSVSNWNRSSAPRLSSSISNAAPTVLRCTPCRNANARIERPFRRSSRRIASNNSVRLDPLSASPSGGHYRADPGQPRTREASRRNVGPNQAGTINRSAGRWGPIKPPKSSPIRLTEPPAIVRRRKGFLSCAPSPVRVVRP
jgi:hypothetical protein